MNALDKAKQRSFQYWFEDGLNEMGIGCLLILLGFYFYLGAVLPQNGILRTILDISLLLVIPGGAWLVSRGVKYFKEKITYPRTGYVALAQKRRAPLWLAGGISGLAGAFFAAIVIQGNLLQWIPALTGIIFCLVFVFIAARVNLLRFFILASISLAIGIAISMGDFGLSEGTSAVYFSLGLVVLVSGACNLAKYLRQTPAVKDPSHE